MKRKSNKKNWSSTKISASEFDRTFEEGNVVKYLDLKKAKIERPSRSKNRD